MKNIPKHKDDFKTVEIIEKLQEDDLVEILPYLLEWMQDLHWPISERITIILKPRVKLIENQIVSILEGNDNEWKYNVLVCLFLNNNISLEKNLFFDSITRIFYHPTIGEKEEGVWELSHKILGS